MRNTYARLGGLMKPIGIKGISLLVCMALATSLAHAQGVGSSGSIRGTVTDPAGGVMPRATIVAEDAEKGVRYTSMTDENGQYEFVGLPPGTYRVTAKISGFQTEILKHVAVSVGQTVVLDISMKISSGAEVIEVNAEPPVVETVRGHKADIVTGKFIEGLPIDIRSEEHTSELQSHHDLVCRLLLEKKKIKNKITSII